jgi:hypothetical protein
MTELDNVDARLRAGEVMSREWINVRIKLGNVEFTATINGSDLRDAFEVPQVEQHVPAEAESKDPQWQK